MKLLPIVLASLSVSMTGCVESGYYGGGGGGFIPPPMQFQPVEFHPIETDLQRGFSCSSRQQFGQIVTDCR